MRNHTRMVDEAAPPVTLKHTISHHSRRTTRTAARRSRYVTPTVIPTGGGCVLILGLGLGLGCARDRVEAVGSVHQLSKDWVDGNHLGAVKQMTREIVQKGERGQDERFSP